MNKTAVGLALVGLLLWSGPGVCENWTGNLNTFTGYKNQTDSFFKDAEVDDHFEFGLMLDFKQEDWPVSIAIDYFRSASGEQFFVLPLTLFGIELDSRTQEWNVGVRKIWSRTGQGRTFLGGGVAIIRNEINLTGASDDDDTGTGFWVDTGAYATLAEHVNLGIDIRYSYAEVDLLGEKPNAGGYHIGLILGVHW